MRGRILISEAKAFAALCVCATLAMAAPKPVPAAPAPAPAKSAAAAPAQPAGKSGAGASQANVPAPTRSGLDTGSVRKLYLDGDFEEAIRILETSLKAKAPYDHFDSVFIFKHLGVMYAANYETREKGKYYMHQLLTVEPTARIMDMYASDMIYMIFKNIQDEFESSRMRYERAESHLAGNGMTGTEGKPAETPKPRSGRKAFYWLGATGLVVAAGATAYLVIVNQPGETTTHEHKVPN